MKKSTNRTKTSARKKNVNFERIMRGLDDAATYARGEADLTKYRVHVPASVDVAAIRAKLGLTQKSFAARFGFSRGAVRDWEQGRKVPEASARILLKVIDRRPDVVLEILDDAA
jgi:putative transcriptional regulator